MAADDRNVLPIGPKSPEICKILKGEFGGARTVRLRSCEFPFATLRPFEGQTWVEIDPKTNIELIKEYIFWQFWKLRIANVSEIAKIRDTGLRALVGQIEHDWRHDKKITVSSVLAYPPKDFGKVSEDLWRRFRKPVMKMISASQLKVESSSFDLNGDGKVDRVYRISDPQFVAYELSPPGRSKASQCFSSDGARSTRQSLFVSSKDDVALSRSVQYYRFAIYDTFTFRGRRYFAAAPANSVELGWLTTAQNTKYFPTFLDRDVPGSATLFRTICQFNSKEARP